MQERSTETKMTISAFSRFKLIGIGAYSVYLYDTVLSIYLYDIGCILTMWVRRIKLFNVSIQVDMMKI